MEDDNKKILIDHQVNIDSGENPIGLLATLASVSVFLSEKSEKISKIFTLELILKGLFISFAGIFFRLRNLFAIIIALCIALVYLPDFMTVIIDLIPEPFRNQKLLLVSLIGVSFTAILIFLKRHVTSASGEFVYNIIHIISLITLLLFALYLSNQETKNENYIKLKYHKNNYVELPNAIKNYPEEIIYLPVLIRMTSKGRIKFSKKTGTENPVNITNEIFIATNNYSDQNKSHQKDWLDNSECSENYANINPKCEIVLTEKTESLFLIPFKVSEIENGKNIFIEVRSDKSLDTDKNILASTRFRFIRKNWNYEITTLKRTIKDKQITLEYAVSAKNLFNIGSEKNKKYLEGYIHIFHAIEDFAGNYINKYKKAGVIKILDTIDYKGLIKYEETNKDIILKIKAVKCITGTCEDIRMMNISNKMFDPKEDVIRTFNEENKIKYVVKNDQNSTFGNAESLNHESLKNNIRIALVNSSGINKLAGKNKIFLQKNGFSKNYIELFNEKNRPYFIYAYYKNPYYLEIVDEILDILYPNFRRRFFGITIYQDISNNWVKDTLFDEKKFDIVIRLSQRN